MKRPIDHVNRHVQVAARLTEIADTMLKHPLHRELVGNEKLAMLAVRQMVIDCAVNEVDIANAIREEHNV